VTLIQKTAIIVEDLAITALDLKFILKNCGFSNTLIIHSGRKAIEFIELETPTLGLLDIKLADDISGIEVAKKLKEKNIPFIFISAFSDPINLKLAEELKPLGIIKKPVMDQQVNQLVAEYFN
jgi:two-component system, NtrC family, response regulator HydG